MLTLCAKDKFKIFLNNAKIKRKYFENELRSIITTPVIAASTSTATASKKTDITDQILTIVQDIQTKGTTILTKLTSLQTDIMTIKTTTSSIDQKLQTPPGATSNEYYTAPMQPFGEYDTYTYAKIINVGDTPADACYYQYHKHANDPFVLQHNGCYMIDPMSIKASTTLIADSLSIYYYKITTTSKSVVPYVVIGKSIGGEVITKYLPGDFQKIEIYS
jgi:hypothetical protein